MVYDENLNVIDDPDFAHGQAVPVVDRVHHEWAGGGWVTTIDGRRIDWDGDIPDGVEHDPFDEDWHHLSFVPYTEEELRRNEEEAAEAARRAELDAWLAGAPEQVADLDEAVVELYEAQAQAQLDTDEAITAIYETMIGGKA